MDYFHYVYILKSKKDEKLIFWKIYREIQKLYIKMSKVSKSKKNSTTHYYGCVYGGIMKQGYVSFFSTTEDPEEHFSQFKNWYGSKVRGRYVKTSDEDDCLEKLGDKLKDHNVHGQIYEVSVDTASKTLKELTGAKKTSLLGEDEVQHDEEKGGKSEDEEKSSKVKSSSKKVTSSKSSKKSKASDSDDESDEEKEEKNTSKKSSSKKSKDDSDDEKKKKSSSSKSSKKAKAVESDDDSDQEPSEAESDSDSDSEPEEKPKSSSKKSKKETKASK